MGIGSCLHSFNISVYATHVGKFKFAVGQISESSKVPNRSVLLFYDQGLQSTQPGDQNSQVTTPCSASCSRNFNGDDTGTKTAIAIIVIVTIVVTVWCVWVAILVYKSDSNYNDSHVDWGGSGGGGGGC